MILTLLILYLSLSLEIINLENISFKSEISSVCFSSVSWTLCKYWVLYRPGGRMRWRGILSQCGRVDKAPGWQKRRKSGGSWSRQLLSWRVPISSIPKPAVIGFEMKPPDASLDDQAIRDRRKEYIAEGSGRFVPGFRSRGWDRQVVIP